MKFTLYGDPRTKKNGMRIVRIGAGSRLLPSKAYLEYKDDCLRQITPDQCKSIDGTINLCCVYYMKTRRRVDLCNLLEATCDILVDAGVLADDNSSIVGGHDGSRVLYAKHDPRVEITIDWLKGGDE